jgi:AraC-like DNA-binding protein
MLHNEPVRIWQSHYDASTRTHHHAIEGAGGHAMLSQVAAFTFKALGVSTSVFDGNLWWPIHVEPGVKDFEPGHGKDADRGTYNKKKLAEVARRRQLVQGEHAGYSDLFQPVVLRGRIAAVLVAGPFARARPTASFLLERWRWLTGRQAHPSDPEFASYLSATFSTLVLEGRRAALFERLLDRFALILAEHGRADTLTNEADALRAELEQARAVERAWEAVRSMVDERSSQNWHGKDLAWTLGDLGLSRVPDGVLVGLTVSRTARPDGVEEAIRRDAFQRRSVDLAHSVGNALAGQVGGHGVVFVSSRSGSPERRRQYLFDMADRAEALARRFGLSAHFGVSLRSGSVPLSRSYQIALGAAQSALTQRARVVTAEPDVTRAAYSLRHLREELGRAVEEKPELSGARFDRYLEAVALHCGHRMEPAQAHLEVGFERMADVLCHSGALDARSFTELHAALDRAAAEARTITDLFDAYRRAAADIARAAESPVRARHDRSLRAAIEYIHEHYGERLRLGTVARVAGFSAPYFSGIFAEKQGKPFERYVRELRLERAKQLLTASRVPVTRVAALSGFRSLQYFARVFHKAFRITPSRYRATAGRRKDALYQST